MTARAAILSIGDELFDAPGADGNGPWLAEELRSRAVDTVERRIVGDDREPIAGAVREMSARADLLITTGGLGPTPDDLTRFALGDVLCPGESLVADPRAKAHLEARFRRAGRTMPRSNLLQALRPPAMEFLDNPLGTAMGLAGRAGPCQVFALPGPPHEMRAMFRDQVVPRLPPPPPEGRVAISGCVHAFGLGESAAAEMLGGILERGREPLVGITLSRGIVTARIRATGPPAEARGRLDAAAWRILELWAPWSYGRDGATLASAAGALLAASGSTVATAESCTGGLLGGAIVDVPGSSTWYAGGWVTYSDDLKRSCLGVRAELLAAHGAVSAPAAAAMAGGALDRGGSGWALAITGIAGPEGGTEAKPVGTVFIALARRGAGPVPVRRFRFPGDRRAVREISASAALQILRLGLLGRATEERLLWELASP